MTEEQKESMIRTAMVGLGKMGLSHLAIVRSHPLVDLVAGCDAAAYLTDSLKKHADLNCYSDYDRLLAEETLDAIVIATPSKFHAAMIEKALDKGLHVFCEKPFVLNCSDGERLVELAESRKLVNQVGYHYRFVGAFQEAARIVRSGALGRVHHIRAEAYGPVVLRSKGATWRSSRNEGGGALYDYACHALDLVNFIHEPPSGVSGVVRTPVFSSDVDDEVYCTLHFPNSVSGQLCVNWSDESQRKMSTKVSVWGTNGRVVADRQECQLFLRESHPGLPEVEKGWTVRYTTDLTNEVWYYLRGEEYSAQIDHFFTNIREQQVKGENSFRSALNADRVAAMILGGQPTLQSAPLESTHSSRGQSGIWAKMFGR